MHCATRHVGVYLWKKKKKKKGFRHFRNVAGGVQTVFYTVQWNPIDPRLVFLLFCLLLNKDRKVKI